MECPNIYCRAWTILEKGKFTEDGSRLVILWACPHGGIKVMLYNVGNMVNWKTANG